MYSLVNREINAAVMDQINKEYQIYFLFVIFLISLQLICNTIEPIIFTFGIFKMPASAMFYVFSFAICDVITENFGFKLAVRATVLNVIAQLIYCGIATATFLVPIQFQAPQAAESFRYIFHFISLELLSSIFALLISMITNDYLINRLKLIFLGRGFWWRTIVSTVLGEIVMLNIDYNITFMGAKDLIQIQQLIISSLGYKIIAAFVLAFPATLVSQFLSKNVQILKPNMNQKTGLIVELKNAFSFR